MASKYARSAALLIQQNVESERNDIYKQCTTFSWPQLQTRSLALSHLEKHSWSWREITFSHKHPLGVEKLQVGTRVAILRLRASPASGLWRSGEEDGTVTCGYVATFLPHLQRVVVTAGDGGFEDLKYMQHEDNARYCLVKRHDPIPTDRMKNALMMLPRTRKALVRRCFAQDQTQTKPFVLSPETAAGLDASQCKAAELALGSKPIGLIHGPPGTGKTTTLVAVIKELVAKKRKTLVCAPSNAAVENILVRCVKEEVGAVCFVGRLSRMDESVHKFVFEELVKKHRSFGLLRDLRNQLSGDCRGTRREIKTQIYQLKTKIHRDVFNTAQVVFSTCSSAGGKTLEELEAHFDTVVVDEAAQTIEPECWVPLMLGDNAILAGDELQLGPIVQSKTAEAGGLGISLFERLKQSQENRTFDLPIAEGIPSAMLEVQYRMNRKIMQWSSNRFYEGKLCAASAVSDWNISEFAPAFWTKYQTPLLFVDTSHDLRMKEDRPGGVAHATMTKSLSKGNWCEASLVVTYLSELVSAGLTAGQIFVITPYRLHAMFLRHMTKKPYLPEEVRKIEISTVDSFQGREAEVVVMSLVRSNSRGKVGFLSNHRRLNVAVTRARRQLVIVGSRRTVERDPTFSSLLDFVEKEGRFVDSPLIQIPEVDLYSYGPGVHKVGEAKIRNEDCRKKFTILKPKAADLSEDDEAKDEDVEKDVEEEEEKVEEEEDEDKEEDKEGRTRYKFCDAWPSLGEV